MIVILQIMKWIIWTVVDSDSQFDIDIIKNNSLYHLSIDINYTFEEDLFTEAECEYLYEHWFSVDVYIDEVHMWAWDAQDLVLWMMNHNYSKVLKAIIDGAEYIDSILLV